MSFYDLLMQQRYPDMNGFLFSVSQENVEQILSREHLSTTDFISLLSSAAGQCLEAMAQKAVGLTRQHFGRTIQLYTPLYLSDHCENRCVYCSFSAGHSFTRRKLSLEEVEREAACIALTGLRHILILTGESRKESPVGYIADCARILKRYFHSIAVEIYPLTTNGYENLLEAGVDGLTIYQETYDETVYRDIHPVGPKRNYRFRLEAPERGGQSRMRQVNIGVLLGLTDWRKDVFALGLHARYLMDRYPEVELGVSVPRLRPHAGQYAGSCPVTDRELVQIILALRLFIPRLGISLSTREDACLRDNLLPLGITRLSAGSVTAVGGHTKNAGAEDALPQFQIADHRKVEEMMAIIRGRGYNPILSDWGPYDI